SYVSDGEMIGNDTHIREGLDSALEGVVVDFQRDLSFDNWVEVEFDREVTPEEAQSLADRLVNFEHKGVGNASFMIEGVTMKSATRGIIDFGGITLINSYVDAKNEELGYKYDVDVGKTFEIPLSYEENAAPVFDEVSENFSTSAGNSISVKVNATAENDGEVTYSARTLPRGASFNAETRVFSWKPDASQIGESLVAIDAVDEYGRISTQFFTITVYGSTTGGSSSVDEKEETPSSGNSGGSGGGGGGETTTPTTPTTPEKDEEGTITPTTPSTGNEGETSGENVRFIDLGNHAWAEDAINALAEDGVIKGTTGITFSPAANITRADFALLLVRAFKLESESVENFADVSANDYFASELAVARNTGIVNGIGDNKYAPRKTITRQDMMVIVYRALTKLGVVLESADVEYEDFVSVADYAQDAVKALISSGLVNGKNGKIAPTDYTTRAEVAVLLKRIIDYTSK
ncbi:MAG: S-layer homology domain-containing protein, partial [Oscillospiraceae bacterium]|nr:S-layer homology domain-containing protein [Oscillospiraceae bacterium]